MMENNRPFDVEKAGAYLRRRKQHRQASLENCRQNILHHTISVLGDFFRDSKVEIYLTGSIIEPYLFQNDSDIDIVLRNFAGERLEIHGQIEKLLGRPVDVILFEKCHFKDYILKHGLKVF